MTTTKITSAVLFLLLGISTACGGATPAEETAAAQTEQAEMNEEQAEQDVEHAEETEEIIEDHDPEAIDDAAAIHESTE